MALTLTGNGLTALYIRSIAFHIQIYACCWIWTDLNILAYPFVLPEKKRTKKLIIKRSSFYYSLCKWIDSFILEIFPFCFGMSLTRLTAYISKWVSTIYSIAILSVFLSKYASVLFLVNTSLLSFFRLFPLAWCKPKSIIFVTQNCVDTAWGEKAAICLRRTTIRKKGAWFFLNKNWIGHNARQITSIERIIIIHKSKICAWQM